ncbi:MAG: type III pantothenate kinase [Caldisericia bacterium]
MLLTIDIGNTNIVLGVFKKNEIIKTYRLSSRVLRTSDEYALDIISLLYFDKITNKDIDDVIISSVVPPLDPIFERAIEKIFNKKPIFVNLSMKFPIKIKIDNINELGIDRLVGSSMAYEITKNSTVVVDFGTATTFDVIDKNGVFIGGAIAPGILLSLESLITRTAKLPKVELTLPDSPIGKNTINAIQSGFLYGWSGIVEKVVKEIENSLSDSVNVIITGGASHFVLPLIKLNYIYERDLILKGLKLIYDLNKK